jgi:hypothetical protein
MPSNPTLTSLRHQLTITGRLYTSGRWLCFHHLVLQRTPRRPDRSVGKDSVPSQSAPGSPLYGKRLIPRRLDRRWFRRELTDAFNERTDQRP